MKSGRKNKGKKILVLLVFIIFVLIVINYSRLDNSLKNVFSQTEIGLVERTIDGDTISIKGINESVRLLGINTPERGEFFYEESREFLEKSVLGRNVTLEYVGSRYDKYNRVLAYVWLNSTNVNLNMVENGFANYYFYKKDKYSEELLDAWNNCLANKVNMCEPSNHVCASCVKLSGSAIINQCTRSCDITDWQVWGEGREKFIFSQSTLQPGASTGFALDLSNTGGSLFLRDDEGKLVEWRQN